MRFLRKYQYHIFLFTVGVFLVGMFAGFGSYFLGGKGSPTDSVVDVAGDPVPLHVFYSRYDRALAQLKPGTTLDEAGRREKRDEVIRDLVQETVFRQQARHFGIIVPDQQVAMSIAQYPAFQEKGAFSPQAYMRALQYQLRATPHDFEEEQRDAIAFYKLRWLIQSCIKVTDKEAEMQYGFEHGGKLAGFQKDRTAYTDKLWQSKVLWSLNQWFSQLSQHTTIKPHTDVIEGIK
ncbi:MAG TPA: SurA N-terminal domain-containing protein [Elusimicrobiota bacterium]|nr:SurA N-terminal domain-containing protein [Elusimicrobiota bacterium]